MDATHTQTYTLHFPSVTRPLIRFSKILLMGGILLGMIIGYYFSGTPITLRVNGMSHSLRLHELTVDRLLLQTGITLRPEDRITPPPGSPLSPGQMLDVTLARPIIVDGPVGEQQQPQTIYTQHHTPLEIYRTLGYEIQPEDDVYVDGVIWSHTEPIPERLPQRPGRTTTLQTRLEALRPVPVRLVLRPALAIQVVDRARELNFLTTHQTVGDLLVAHNLPLYLGDTIIPSLSSPLTGGLTIAIERALPVTIQVDGVERRTRSRQPTIGALLAEEEVALMGQDYTIPAEDEPLTAGATIRVVRVTEELKVTQETTDFETRWVADPTLELDVQQVREEGQAGISKTRTRVRYENGVEVFSQEEETWQAQAARDRTVAYGTDVVVRTVPGPDGPITYWRKIRMLATAYSAATSGKSKDHPAYGITRTGLLAGYGIVAVDPRVVALRSQVYVPGYGQAIAGDTGGAILGKRIDLGYDEDDPPVAWYTWVDVYLLTPAPPQNSIRYVLPQWPQER